MEKTRTIYVKKVVNQEVVNVGKIRRKIQYKYGNVPFVLYQNKLYFLKFGGLQNGKYNPAILSIYI